MSYGGGGGYGGGRGGGSGYSGYGSAPRGNYSSGYSDGYEKAYGLDIVVKLDVFRYSHFARFREAIALGTSKCPQLLADSHNNSLALRLRM